MVHKKADKILHLPSPPLRDRPLLKALYQPFKHQTSPEGTIETGELKFFQTIDQSLPKKSF